MIVLKTEKLPDEVFTPRAPTINPRMYIDRGKLEKDLAKQIRGGRHIILHGESGNGKTWLYKKVFSDHDVPHTVVNLANASRLGSLQMALKDKIKKQSPGEKLSQKVVNKSAGLNVPFAKANISDQKIYEIVEREPLEALMSLLYREASGKKSIIIFDNFEQIVEKPDVIKEISDAIILLDDEDYAQFGVKFCIVGVPSDIREYISNQASLETISNRVVEVPEVARLSLEESRALLKRGLIDELNLSVDDQFIENAVWKTDRIAQHLHEFGLECAREAIENDRMLDQKSFERAELSWFSTSISVVQEAVSHNMNARETRAGRRNQLIYALGCLKTEDFKYADLETLIREEFPDSTRGVILNVAQTLSTIEKSQFPLVKRVPKGDAYRLINPKTKIAIRVMIRKSKDGRAEKIPTLT